MKTLLKISWRNVWRNKARSIVIILAVAFGLWGGVFATAFMTAMVKQMFDSRIKSAVSHIQIHHPDFVTDGLAEFAIADAEQITAEIRKYPNLVAMSARTLSNGMLANANMSSGVEIFGVDPLSESATTHFEDNLLDGDYFISVSRNPILIGEKLAKKMNIVTGNRLVLTFQSIGGDITAASFRVCGIYRTANSMDDERKVYVKQDDLSALLGDGAIVNEIAVVLDDIVHAEAFRDKLKNLFPEYEIRTWLQIAPELSFYNELSGMAMMVLVIIILLALAFGLLNTMLMTIFERTRELGVLISIGMSKLRVFSMILLETFFLVSSGALLGTGMGALSVNLTRKTGIDLTAVGGEVLSDYGMDTMIYPQLEEMFYLNLAILVLFTAIIASLYPAYKALKLKPAEAVRKE